MWRDQEADAIRVGLSLDYFWSLNVKQWAKYIQVYNEKEQERIEEADRLNYMLGQYIAYAYHDPKHYPKEPFLAKPRKNEKVIMTDDDMERQARLNTIRKGGKVNDS